LFRKFYNIGDIVGGYGGGDVAFAILTSTMMLVSNSDQGGLPVTISKTVHPKLQISANLLCPVYVITSGAIQYGVPVRVL